MPDYPVLFSAPMIRALLDGRKTMTRRLAGKNGKPTPWQKVRPGDRLWVRETWQSLSFGDYEPTTAAPADVRYFATDALANCDREVRGYPWRPSIHMPRWASRLTLIVEEPRIERLQEITEADAIAEGAPCLAVDEDGKFFADVPGATHRCGFAGLWDHLNGAGAWDENPEVVALKFRVVRENIDKIVTEDRDA